MAAEAQRVRVGAGLSADALAVSAARAAARSAADASGPSVDLAFVFLSATHLREAAAAVQAVRDELRPRHLLGCVADGVLAGRRELEDGPAVAVWAASLPGATIECFHAVATGADDGVTVTGFPALADPSLVALLVDPFTFPAGPVLQGLNDVHARVPLVGGVATGGGRPGLQALVVDDEVHEEGAVGAVVAGIPVLTVVSQGCRSLGHESVVTRCDGNVVYELAGVSALERLRHELGTLAPSERELAARGLLVGIVIDENRPEYGTGDFLMRGLLGADEATGAIAVGEAVRVGQTLQFFARDAVSADADLRRSLAAAIGGRRPAGSLLFTCNGRGRNMFDDADHDARVVAEILGSDALAGFFCGGEIGPVGGKAFLHGFTATLAVFLDG